MRGDLGESIRNYVPVSEAIREQLPSTVALAMAALAIALVLGFILGLIAALNYGSWFDTTLMGISVSGMSVPTFWLGLLLIMFFSVQLKWFPSISNSNDFSDLFLPALTLALPEAAIIARMVRASMLDVLGKEYVTVARAKGLPEHGVVLGHAMRNALIPIVTFVGLQMAYLLGGSAIVETMFARQGIGRLAVDAINNRDYPMVQGVVLVVAVDLCRDQHLHRHHLHLSQSEDSPEMTSPDGPTGGSPRQRAHATQRISRRAHLPAHLSQPRRRRSGR